MARSKKSRRVSDIMPMRKVDKATLATLGGTKSRKQVSRYELDAQAREDKKKRKHKGLSSGARNGGLEKKEVQLQTEKKDPRIGSRKPIPLVVEFVNKDNKKPEWLDKKPKKVKVLTPEEELMKLESNECLNDLLDEIDEGKKLSKEDQKFVDECLARIAQLMDELGIEEEDENPEETLYRAFEQANLNEFK